MMSGFGFLNLPCTYAQHPQQHRPKDPRLRHESEYDPICKRDAKGYIYICVYIVYQPPCPNSYKSDVFHNIQLDICRYIYICIYLSGHPPRVLSLFAVKPQARFWLDSIGMGGQQMHNKKKVLMLVFFTKPTGNKNRCKKTLKPRPFPKPYQKHTKQVERIQKIRKPDETEKTKQNLRLLWFVFRKPKNEEHQRNKKDSRKPKKNKTYAGENLGFCTQTLFFGLS